MPDYEIIGPGSIPGTTSIRAPDGSVMDVIDDQMGPGFGTPAPSGQLGGAGASAPFAGPPPENSGGATGSWDGPPDPATAGFAAPPIDRSEEGNANVRAALAEQAASEADPYEVNVQAVPRRPFQETVARADQTQATLDMLQRGTGGGGPRRTSTKTTSFEGYAPRNAEEAALLASLQQRQGALLGEAQQLREQALNRDIAVREQAATESAGQISQLDEQRAQDAKRFREAQDARRRQIEDRAMKLQGSMDEVAEAKIEPKSIWSSERAGEAVQFGLAGVLAIAADALTRGRAGAGKALQAQVNRIVERDLEIQRQKLEDKKERNRAESSQIDKLTADLGDREAAFYALRAMKLEDMNLRLEGIKQRATGGLQAQAAMEAQAAIREAQAGALKEAMDRSIPIARLESTEVRKSGGGGGRRKLHPELAKRIIDSGVPEEEAMKDIIARRDKQRDEVAFDVDQIAKEEGNLARIYDQGSDLLREIEENGLPTGAGELMGPLVDKADETGFGRMIIPDSIKDFDRKSRAVVDPLLREAAGANLTAVELERERKRRRIGVGFSERDNKAGLRDLLGEVEARKRAARARGSNLAVEEFERRAGRGGASSGNSYQDLPEVK